MTRILAIDTSSSATVLGLMIDDDIIDRTTTAVNSHSREILPLINGLMADSGVALADLDVIVFGQGPGSFTGLRIAAGVVQGLAYGLKRPVVQVSTMACLAQSLSGAGADNVLVALSARLEEIYYGTYRFEDGFAVPVGAEGVADVSTLQAQTLQGEWAAIGDAFHLADKIQQAMAIRFSSAVEAAIPSVQDLLTLGRRSYEAGDSISALQVAPVYLREEVAARPAASISKK